MKSRRFSLDDAPHQHFCFQYRSISQVQSERRAPEELVLGEWGSKSVEVRRSRVALAEHVGHTVTATGVVSNAKMHNLKEDAKETAKDSGMKKSDAEHGHMKITDVKMVSESCK